MDLQTPSSLGELAETCATFYEMNKNRMVTHSVCRKQSKLSLLVEKFHKECGTLTPIVQKGIRDLRSGQGIILMTAHQPNLFAYSGVLRKATLSFVLSKELEKRLKIPVISFFGIADQDFTDDRWVRTALLPDVQRRNGVLGLRANLPRKRLLNKTAKPSQIVLNNWRSDIEKWLENKIGAIQKLCRTLNPPVKLERGKPKQDFDSFWKMVEEAQSAAQNFADFNAFTISKIVNDVWKYDTLFSRFSEFQGIFKDEFDFLLRHFDSYSRHVKEAIEARNLPGGVFAQEHTVIPFWLHCECGSKARLKGTSANESLVGQGACLLCGKEYTVNLGSKKKPSISSILDKTSLRSLSMPLVFFEGLRVCCYVGGIAGMQYLEQARHVAESMGLFFPPIALWRPRDTYAGIGQLEASLVLAQISGTSDFSRIPETKATLQRRIIRVQRNIQKLVAKKKNVIRADGESKEPIDVMKSLWHKQIQERKTSNYAVLIRNMKLLENAENVWKMHPSIIDYVVNIGLESVSEQWSDFLKENQGLTQDVHLKSEFDAIAKGFDLCQNSH